MEPSLALLLIYAISAAVPLVSWAVLRAFFPAFPGRAAALLCFVPVINTILAFKTLRLAFENRKVIRQVWRKTWALWHLQRFNSLMKE